MTTDGQEIWESYKRGIKRSSKNTRAKTSSASPKAPQQQAVAKDAPLQPRGEAKQLPSHALERAREKSLRRGDIEIEGKIDLHGMSQVKAFDALAKFMERCVKLNKRSLLIITGKGSDGTGVLRKNLREWLGQLPEAKSILALRQAAPRHGGAGAFYVILRAKRV